MVKKVRSQKVGSGASFPSKSEGRGTMLLDARIHMRSTPLQMIWPGLAVVTCVLAINVVGDSLRDALADRREASRD